MHEQSYLLTAANLGSLSTFNYAPCVQLMTVPWMVLIAAPCHSPEVLGCE